MIIFVTQNVNKNKRVTRMLIARNHQRVTGNPYQKKLDLSVAYRQCGFVLGFDNDNLRDRRFEERPSFVVNFGGQI